MSKRVCTLVFPQREGIIWLARKKLKVGAGLLNGWGGKLEPEDGGLVRLCACREFQAEAGARIYPSRLHKKAVVDFSEGGQEAFECHVYFVSEWEGDIREGEEMGPPLSFPINCLPYEEMMPGDREWFPRVLLTTEPFRAKVHYATGNTHLVQPVEYGPLAAAS